MTAESGRPHRKLALWQRSMGLVTKRYVYLHQKQIKKEDERNEKSTYGRGDV